MKPLDILVFSAHTADFCSRSGGTLSLYARAGAKIHVIEMTMGERGESEDYWGREGPKSMEEAKRTRVPEGEAAAAILGVSIEFLDYGDYPLMIDRERLDALARVIRARRPDVILTHWKIDPTNVDHEVTTASAIRAATMAAMPGFANDESAALLMPHTFGFEPSVPLDDDAAFQPDTYVDITDVFETKIKALQALESQKALPARYTQWAEYRGTQATRWAGRPIKYAEAFKRMTPAVGNRLPVAGG